MSLSRCAQRRQGDDLEATAGRAGRRGTGPRSTSRGRCSLVAATMRTSTWIGATRRSGSPRHIRPRAAAGPAPRMDRVASSSRNRCRHRLPRTGPARDLVAPVNAPASWPNNSASISVSGSAAQFMTTSGPSQRDDRWCRRSAISSLPVPRSPITSTGRSSGAARLARSTASRKEEDWPTSWVLRSIPRSWDNFPPLGKS